MMRLDYCNYLCVCVSSVWTARAERCSMARVRGSKQMSGTTDEREAEQVPARARTTGLYTTPLTYHHNHHSCIHTARCSVAV